MIFFTSEDMKYINMDLWRYLGLPINLYNKIMEKCKNI